jgi:CSLREA domain-containing protein
VAVLAALALAATITVTTMADENGSGPNCSLHEAIAAANAGDFPDTCAIGVCGCPPDASHAVRVCDCAVGTCFDGTGCVRQ